MIKKVFLTLLCCFSVFIHTQAQSARVDSIAAYILQRMSMTMQSIESCSFNSETNYDVWQDELGYIKHSNSAGIYIQFPNKLKVNQRGDNGHQSLIYDGSLFVNYSFDKNQYSSIPVEGDIVQVMDTINKTFGIDFPAADFFYSSFLEDLVNTGGNLVYLGITKVGDKNCFHIAGKDVNDTGFQFWITEDDYFLPVKMVLIYKTSDGQSQFEAKYSDWKLNETYPSSLFEFVIPPKANEVKLIPSSK